MKDKIRQYACKIGWLAINICLILACMSIPVQAKADYEMKYLNKPDNTRTVYLEEGEFELEIQELDAGLDISKISYQWRVSDAGKKVLSLISGGKDAYAEFSLKKEGSAVIYCCVTYEGKRFDLSKKVTVKRANAIRSLQVNGSEYKGSIKNKTTAELFSNGKQLKLQLAVRPGWSIQKISYAPWKDSYMYDTPKKISNNKAVKNGKYGGYYELVLSQKARSGILTYGITVYTYDQKTVTYGKPGQGTELRLKTLGDSFDNFRTSTVNIWKYKKSADSEIDCKEKNGKKGKTCQYTACFRSGKDLVKKINRTYHENSAVWKNRKIVMRIRKLDSTAEFKVKNGRGMKVFD